MLSVNYAGTVVENGLPLRPNPLTVPILGGKLFKTALRTI